MDSIKNRRSIRKYKQDEIPASLLNDLLEEAFRASTMGNMQLYSVVVTRDKQMKEKSAYGNGCTGGAYFLCRL